MSVNLNQINVTYIPKEDRLLVKTSSSDGEEYRIWYTRRFTMLLMDVIDQNFLAESRTQGAVTEEAQTAFAEYQHMKNVQEDCFADEYRGATGQDDSDIGTPEQISEQIPGPHDLLAHTIKFQTRDDGDLTLSIVAGADQTLTLNMDSNMKHQFYELVRRAAIMADWLQSAAAQSLDVLSTRATH